MMAPEPPPAPEEPSDNQPSEPTAEPVVEPVETAGVGRPKRNRAPPKSYIPSMKGNRYSYACQALPGGALHPDLHMAFLQHMIEKVPDAVGAILTQLSMKAGLKEWGKDAEKAVYDKMKTIAFQKHFCAKTLEPIDKGTERTRFGVTFVLETEERRLCERQGSRRRQQAT